jgi:hypothetical protein
MNMVKLSAETKRAVFRLLCSASLARHLARTTAEHGWTEREDYYRSENRRFLAEARCLVQKDLKGSTSLFDTYLSCVSVRAAMKDRREVKRNAPTQVSATAAFRRLQVLCVLGRDGLLPARAVAQGHTLPRLQAPWAAPECVRSMALRTPNAMRQAFTVPPS